MDLTVAFGQLYLASSTDVGPVSCVERCLHHSAVGFIYSQTYLNASVVICIQLLSYVDISEF